MHHTKNHRLLLFPSLFLFLQVLSTQALALEIRVDQYGNMAFYDDSILGTNSNGHTGKETPMRRVPISNRQNLKIEPTEDKINIHLYNPINTGNAGQSGLDNDVKSLDTRRLQLQFPAGSTPAQQWRLKYKKDQQKAQHETATELKNQANEQKEYQEELKEERQKRVKEMLKLRNEISEGEPGLQLESRGVRAHLQGSNFILDPSTNEVTITTPSGQEHVLNHLPDQAIERMKEAGVIDEFTTKENINVVTDENDHVLYQAEEKKMKKFLGLFKRDVKTKITLDDVTGEVSEAEVKGRSVVEKVLNGLSF